MHFTPAVGILRQINARLKEIKLNGGVNSEIEKTKDLADYFEVRYENPADNRRYFYQLDGEGIRGELVEFCRSIKNKNPSRFISQDVSLAISKEMQNFNENKIVNI